ATLYLLNLDLECKNLPVSLLSGLDLAAHAEVPSTQNGSSISLEPISKSPEGDNEAGELNKAQEILGMVFPADENSALPLDPSGEALNEPAAHIAVRRRRSCVGGLLRLARARQSHNRLRLGGPAGRVVCDRRCRRSIAGPSADRRVSGRRHIRDYIHV